MSSVDLAGARGLLRPAKPRAALRLGDRLNVLDRARTPVVFAAAAVALLPLLRPGGPGATAPVDLLIAFALAACVFWGVNSEERWHFPYAFAMFLFLGGGVVGALAGPVPVAGITALIQDVFLLTWCWAVLNICISTSNMRILLRTWAYSSIVWASLLFLGLATGTTALTGRSSNEAGRTMLTFGSPNVAANYLFISVMVIWATGHPRRRLFRFAGYGLLVAALISTGSNSGILSLLIGVAIAALLGVYRRAGTIATVTTLCFLLLGGYAVAATLASRASRTGLTTAAMRSFVTASAARRKASLNAARFCTRASTCTEWEGRSAPARFRRKRGSERSRPRSSRRRTTTTSPP